MLTRFMISCTETKRSRQTLLFWLFFRVRVAVLLDQLVAGSWDAAVDINGLARCDGRAGGLFVVGNGSVQGRPFMMFKFLYSGSLLSLSFLSLSLLFAVCGSIFLLSSNYSRNLNIVVIQFERNGTSSLHRWRSFQIRSSSFRSWEASLAFFFPLIF